MDFSWISHTFNAQFFLSLLSIIIIDLVLAGDNSIVIAMAVQGLKKEQRLKGILFGALAAVLLRVLFTFFASQLLNVSFVKLVGGVLILWIAVKLLIDTNDETTNKSSANTVWKAVWIILVADFTMSLDNILAVAGASHGNLPLLIFGLGLSIPLVIFTSSLISRLMEKYAFIIWIGAAVLGKVGAEMMITDPFIVDNVLSPLGLTELKKSVDHANHILVIICEVAGALGVIAIGLIRDLPRKIAERKAANNAADKADS